MVEELRRRLEAVTDAMRRRGIDRLLVGPSTDLVYLTGFAVAPSERLTLLVVAPEGIPRLVMRIAPENDASKAVAARAGFVAREDRNSNGSLMFTHAAV